MGTAETDIKNLFLAFHEVVKFSEGLGNTVDVKILFKCAKVTEDVCCKLQQIHAVKDFEDKLNNFWAIKGLQSFSVEYFQNASHLVLSRYITDNKFNDNEVKSAVKQFILFKSDAEFIQALQSLTYTQSCVQLLSQKIRDSNLKCFDNKTVQLLEHFKRILTVSNNGVEVVSSAINKSIFDYESFKTSLNILCLPNDCELTLSVQDLVSLNVCNILQNSENKTFYKLVLQMSDECFGHVVNHWRFFTDTIIKMVELSTKKLQCSYSISSYSWKCTGEEKGLSFEEIIMLINKLKVYPTLYARLKGILLLCSEEGFGVIVEDLLRMCKIS